MRLVVDTNVFISGVFFGGAPYEVLDAWRRGKIEFVLSPEILEEYRETGEELATGFPGVDLTPWLDLLAVKATIVDAASLAEPVCTDPDDDKFLACALASRTRLITSGDKALLRASGYQGITVLPPRKLVDEYLKRQD